MCDEHNDNTKFLTGIFVGGIIGALAIFFLGTKEGKKAALHLKRKGEDILEDIEDKITDLEEEGKDLVKKGEKIKEQVLDEMEDASGDMKKAATKKLDAVLARVEDAQEKGLSTTASLRKRIFKNVPKR